VHPLTLMVVRLYDEYAESDGAPLRAAFRNTASRRQVHRPVR
jgi:hypothetical protein